MINRYSFSFADEKGVGNLPVFVLLGLLCLLAVGPFHDTVVNLLEDLQRILGA